jgi:hypothetical protein
VELLTEVIRQVADQEADEEVTDNQEVTDDQGVAQEIEQEGASRRRRRGISSSSIISPPRTRKRYQLNPEDHERMQASGPTLRSWSRSQN